MGLSAASIDAAQLASLRERFPRAFSRTPRERAILIACLVGLSAFIVFCLVRFDASPARIVNGMERFGKIAGALFPPTPGEAFWDLVKAMLESVGMAFLGTLIAAVVAVPLGFLGARNVLPIQLLRFPIRRSFDFLRGVDALVWALVYVRAVGLGPLAGVLAIATTDVGIFAKLFAEAIENVERKQVEGVRAAGGNAVKTVRFGIRRCCPSCCRTCSTCSSPTPAPLPYSGSSAPAVSASRCRTASAPTAGTKWASSSL